MFDQEWKEEKLDRHLLAARSVQFGISYLDDALIGLFPHELFLIGARTGLGKTELATQLALSFSDRGKRVAFFSLESDKWEIQRRLKYRKMAQLFEQHYGNQLKVPRYREWLLQGYDAAWDGIEKFAEGELKLKTLELKVIYKHEGYTAAQFAEDFAAMEGETDIFIVDHLHYFDFFGETETEGLKKAIHLIRNASLHHGKPVILLAHLRKEQTGGKSMPTLNDFHGHSDIVKVATTVLLLSPADADASVGKFPTNFHIAKCRTAAEVTAFAGTVSFDTKNACYTKNYLISTIKSGEATPISEKTFVPDWAKNAVIKPPTYYRKDY